MLFILGLTKMAFLDAKVFIYVLLTRYNINKLCHIIA